MYVHDHVVLMHSGVREGRQFSYGRKLLYTIIVLTQHVIIRRVKFEVWINDDGSLIYLRNEVRIILIMGCDGL